MTITLIGLAMFIAGAASTIAITKAEFDDLEVVSEVMVVTFSLALIGLVVMMGGGMLALAALL